MLGLALLDKVLVAADEVIE